MVLFASSQVQNVIFHYYKCGFHWHMLPPHPAAYFISEQFFFHCGLVKVVRGLNLD